jgi:tetratricopeptide (TPR) repeat protein
MLVNVPLPAPSDSLFLWSTWFSEGQRALDRRELAAAVEWLGEALKLVAQGGPHDYEHARTQAMLAYAHFRQAEAFDVCGEDACRGKEDRERYCARAIAERDQARHHAACALPRLAGNDKPDTRAARGRAALVLGSLQVAAEQPHEAAASLKIAYEALWRLAGQVALYIETLKRIIETADRLGHYRQVIFYAQRLEDELVGATSRKLELAWAVAIQAEMLLYLGEYSQADALHSRWKGAAGECVPRKDCSLLCAYGLCVFGRSRFALGHYNVAEAYLELSIEIFCELKRRCLPGHPVLEFEALLAYAELLRRKGEFECAERYLCQAEVLLPICLAQFGAYGPSCAVRFRLAKGHAHLDLGQLEAACKCFLAALDIAEQQCAARYFLVVPCLLGLARIESERGHAGAALAYVNRALCVVQEAKATEAPEMAWTLHELAYAYLQDNKVEEAAPAAFAALGRLAASLRRDHPDEGEIRLTHSQSASSRHQVQLAKTQAERADKLFLSHVGNNLFALSRAMQMRAHILHTQRCLDSAFCLLECAQRVWQAQATPNNVIHPEQALLTLAIATVHAGRGDTKSADKIMTDQKFEKWALQLKGSHEFVGYELHRRANIFFGHRLFAEAEWLYGRAVKEYTKACGPNHPHTCAAREHQKLAACRLAEPPPHEVCACVPWFEPCVERDEHCDGCCPGTTPARSAS